MKKDITERLKDTDSTVGEIGWRLIITTLVLFVAGNELQRQGYEATLFTNLAGITILILGLLNPIKRFIMEWNK